MNRQFWNGKRVLVTGHTGFKGSWLCLWLQHLGARVTGFALQPHTEPSLFAVAKIQKEMQSVIGDIRDLDRLGKLLADERPEIVIHMAAQALVRDSYEDPVETYATNVIGTVNVLEAVRRSNCVRVVVNITSDKCYENREWVWGYRENEPMGGHDPYSSSKGCCELVTSAYRRSFFSDGHKMDTRNGVALASARAGNVIGGGDWAKDRLIPDIIRAFLKREPVSIRFPKSIRPWQHVLEPLRGYLTLAEKLWSHPSDYAEAWNFGPNDEDAKSVGWIVSHLAELWGEGAKYELATKKQPHEAHFLKLDCSKAGNRLAWKPVLRLKRSLEWIVRWYQAYDGGENMHSQTLDEIQRYEIMLDNGQRGL